VVTLPIALRHHAAALGLVAALVIAPAVTANLELLREKGKEEWPKLRSKLLPQTARRETV